MAVSGVFGVSKGFPFETAKNRRYWLSKTERFRAILVLTSD